MGVGWLYPGRETWWWLSVSTQVGRNSGGWVSVPGRATCWGLGVSTQVERHGGG